MSYWVQEANLVQANRNELVSAKKLTDKHVNECCHLLSQQFPDMPSIQSTNFPKEGPEQRTFFHHSGDNWALSDLSPEGVLHYDSLTPKSLHPDLRDQLIALYGKCTVTIMDMQKKGQKDCGCFVVAFCVSILYGDSPEALTYKQADMREHMKLSVESKDPKMPHPTIIIGEI
jgi:hypothetical protein